MDKVDKGKLKVLIKMILLNRSPKKTTSKQLANIINGYSWGFRTPITSAVIGRLMGVELKKTDNHFMDMIEHAEYKKGTVYWISSKEEF